MDSGEQERGSSGRQGDGQGPAKTFRDVVAWQKAHQFVLSVYRLTEEFPRHELFGLTAQLRRAACLSLLSSR